MFLDEARLAARIHHPNVVAPLDVVALEDEIFIVMEYVHGEALFRLLRLVGEEPLPAAIASSVMVQVLLGLHAAHEAADERGNPLCIVHRDVSPQNILVGEDGVARIVDFGIAKAARRVHSTGDRKLKGKLGYMAPEQLRLEDIDRRADVFSAGVVLWEMLTAKRLFPYDEPAKVVAEMLAFHPQPLSQSQPGTSAALDALLMRALQPDPEQRFQTARDMAMALEAACTPAGTLEVAAWVARTAGPALRQRAAWVADAENSTRSTLTVAKGLPQAAPPGSGAPAFIDSTQPFALEAAGAARGTPASSSSLGNIAGLPHARRARGSWIAGITAAALLLAGVVVLYMKLGSDEPASVVMLPGSGVEPPAPEVPADPAPPRRAPASDPAPTPSADLASALDAASSAPSRADAGARALPNGAGRARPAPKAVAAPKPASATKPERKAARRADCDPPYWVDEHSIKRFKPWCFPSR
jgi:serine/threonine-protein kinase